MPRAITAEKETERREKISRTMKGKMPKHRVGGWNKGKPAPWTAERNRKNKGVFAQEKNPNWTGDKIGYSGIHLWLVNTFGKATKCENPDCPGKSTNYDYAKLKGKPYARKRDNFWMLCHSCHIKYDKN